MEKSDTHQGHHQNHMSHEETEHKAGTHHAHGVPGRGGAHQHHTDHSGHEEMFRTRFWVSLFLSIPVVIYSPMVQEWLGFRAPAFPGSEWIPFAFSLVIFAYGGLPFLQMAVPEIRDRRPGMMTLISMAITVALVYSVVADLAQFGDEFYWELVTLIDIMLLGHWVEMRSIRQASGALDELAKLLPDTAERITDSGRTESVPVAELHSGDLLLVRPGDSIPADGEIVEGSSTVNEAMITGESRPVPKGEGDQVIAGTVNGDGSLRMRVMAIGEETALAGIMRMVNQAQQSKSRSQVLADKAAGWLFYVALAAALVTAIAWSAATGFDGEVLLRVVTVLIIACPHALGLAVPLVVSITTEIGANNGVLVRDRLALEAARQVDVVIFDKTGTLTKGEFGVVGIEAAEGWNKDRVLSVAGALEGDSEHLIAQAIRRAAKEQGANLPPVQNFLALKGRGVQGEVDGDTYYIGGPRLLEMLSLEPPEGLSTFSEEAGRKAQTVVFLTTANEVLAAIAVADAMRPESQKAVQALRSMGIEVAMLTGDSRAVASAVASEVGIDLVFAEVLPEHKEQQVEKLQAQGKRVAMVGDGVNDAPALTRADVGIAIGGGTDVAIESAGIILVNSNPLDVVKVIALSRASYRKMIQNLWWAAGYNIIALPLAAGALSPWGISVSPAIAALLMSLSTIIVAINAQTLRRRSGALFPALEV